MIFTFPRRVNRWGAYERLPRVDTHHQLLRLLLIRSVLLLHPGKFKLFGRALGVVSMAVGHCNRQRRWSLCAAGRQRTWARPTWDAAAAPVDCILLDTINCEKIQSVSSMERQIWSSPLLTVIPLIREKQHTHYHLIYPPELRAPMKPRMVYMFVFNILVLHNPPLIWAVCILVYVGVFIFLLSSVVIDKTHWFNNHFCISIEIWGAFLISD